MTDLLKLRVSIPSEQYQQEQISCQVACPVHTDARGYVRAIAEGRFEEAYLIARVRFTDIKRIVADIQDECAENGYVGAVAELLMSSCVVGTDVSALTSFTGHFSFLRGGSRCQILSIWAFGLAKK